MRKHQGPSGAGLKATLLSAHYVYINRIFAMETTTEEYRLV